MAPRRMSYISTSDACHITHKNIKGINLYTNYHDANYQINPMIASYSLFEESVKMSNIHNVEYYQQFPLRNSPNHVHICDGDKGGVASYEPVRHGPVRAAFFSFPVNRVEHQKRIQTATEWLP